MIETFPDRLSHACNPRFHGFYALLVVTLRSR